MKEICKHCKQKFTMGVNGTVDGCDKCTGVERDINGEAWHKNEKRQWRMDVTTTRTFYIFRKDVFKK